MPHEIERRILATTVEVRAGVEGAPSKLTGYAALYDSMSDDLGGFREIIRPGAFARAIAAGQDILVRTEHDSKMLLGRTSAGTARVTIDARGLKYEADLPDTQAGRDIKVLIERGDVRQSSFAFSLPDPEAGQRWSVMDDGTVLRELLDVDLHDCAPVAAPAYAATTVSARALEDAKAARPAQDKTGALVRFRAVRKKIEKRDASFEDKVEAVWGALYDLLGYPWQDPWQENGPGWSIEDTYPDNVIVETSPGTLLRYPVAFDAQNVVTLGAPIPVEAQYVPIVAATGERAAVVDPMIEIHRARMRADLL